MDQSLAQLTSEIIYSEVDLGKALVLISRSAYQAGNSAVGELARKRAEHVYARAARLAHELSEDDSAAIQRSVEHLRTRIEWLSQGAIAAPASRRPADSLDIVDVDQLLESH